MFFIGAGCKLMQDAGLKGVWSTVYKENPLPKMLKGKADSPCLRLEIYSSLDDEQFFENIDFEKHSNI